LTNVDDFELHDNTKSDEEFDMEEEEDIAMVLALHAHKNKRPKHDGPVIEMETIKREGADVDRRDAQLFYRVTDISLGPLPSPVSDGGRSYSSTLRSQ
jgi:hypothetical protein